MVKVSLLIVRAHTHTESREKSQEVRCNLTGMREEKLRIAKSRGGGGGGRGRGDEERVSVQHKSLGLSRSACC